MDKLGNFPSLADISGPTVNYEIYEGTSNRYLGTSSVDLPNIEFETVEVKGSGINGTIDFPVYFNTASLTTTFHWRSLARAAHALLQQKRHDITLYGATQWHDYNTGEQQIIQVKMDMNVLPKNLNLGKFEPSTLMEVEQEFELIYIKILLDGELMLELDKLNYVYNTYDGQTWGQKLKNALTGSIAQSITQAITS